MRQQKRAFFVLEGTDGAGKTTQLSRLKDKLEGAGYEVAVFDFPQYDQPSSYFAKRYLNGAYGTAEEVSPYTGSLFYALDRYEAARDIREALEAGKIVLANRFTGSNMAHQGTKFGHADQRRGFFIWLDNLEFEMLKIPRPTLSLVLHVPADVAQKQVDKKGERRYTDKRRDLHEADLKHLERSVEVYDDMCQLFPKDFARLDCVRSGQLLGVDEIGNLLWEKIKPLLPRVKKSRFKKPAKANLNTLAATRTTNEFSSPKTITINNISALLAATLTNSQELFCSERPSNNRDGIKYYTPELDMASQRLYAQKMDRLFELHDHIVEALVKYLNLQAGKPRKSARDAKMAEILSAAIQAASPVLPLAANVTLDIRTTTHGMADVAHKLSSNELPEARQIAKDYFAKESVSPRKPVHQTSATTLRRLTDEALPDSHKTSNNPVNLVNVWPRNELDIIPDILFEYSNLSLAEIKAAVSDWPYIKRERALKIYLKEHKHSQDALNSVTYTWDILSSFNIFRDIQQQSLAKSSSWQLFTPRYGFDVPKIIEEAELTETFEECFSISLQLYSELQKAGHHQAAQYATLQGHKMRWQLTLSANEAIALLEKPLTVSRSSCSEVHKSLLDSISEVHPLIAESLTAKTAANTSAETAKS